MSTKSREPEFWTILKTPVEKPWTIEEELAKVLAWEIAAEIDKKILESIKKIA